MNNLQKKLKEMFDKDFKIQQELSSLSANGLDFEVFDIEFSDDNEYKLKIEKPKVSKSFSTKYDLISIPKLDFSLEDFIIELEDNFELNKASKASFAATSGFNPEVPSFDEIIDDLYNDFLKEIDTQQKNITELFNTTINLSLGYLKESIDIFQVKIDNYINDYVENINNNKTKIDYVIKAFSSSSNQEKVMSFFKDKYYSSIVLRKLSLSKLKSHIDTIRTSPWYSFPSVLAKIQLILQNYELKKYEYEQLKDKKQKIYDELEDIITEAIENLILDKQELLDEKNLDTQIDFDKYELLEYCLPLYKNLLTKNQVNFEGM